MTPLWFYWSGDHMVPLTRFADRARKQYTVGEKYRLVEEHERSQVTHNHYFATIEEAFRNLPEDIAASYPTSTHLRRWALCKAGYADERSIVATSNEEARKIAAFIRPSDPYAVITVSGNVIKVFTAQSQSKKAMGAKTFQDSKTKTLDIIAGLVGVDADALASNAGKAA